MIFDLLMQLRDGADIRDILPGVLFIIIAVLFSLSLHEMSHALAAYKMGDHTARNLGRLTLNPFSHLDLFGTISMMLFGFGWAKPVPVNSRNFRNPRLGIIVTSVAGPLSNLLLSFISLLLSAIIITLAPVPVEISADTSFIEKVIYFFVMLLYYFHILNLYQAVFNLIPIPPLDGSKILFMFLPAKVYLFVHKYEQIINMVLLALLFTGILSTPLSILCGILSFSMEFIIKLIPGI